MDAKVAASHSVVNADDTVAVTGAVQYGDNMIWVGDTELTIKAAATQPSNVSTGIKLTVSVCLSVCLYVSLFLSLSSIHG